MQIKGTIGACCLALFVIVTSAIGQRSQSGRQPTAQESLTKQQLSQAQADVRELSAREDSLRRRKKVITSRLEELGRLIPAAEGSTTLKQRAAVELQKKADQAEAAADSAESLQRPSAQRQAAQAKTSADSAKAAADDAAKALKQLESEKRLLDVNALDSDIAAVGASLRQARLRVERADSAYKSGRAAADAAAARPPIAVPQPPRKQSSGSSGRSVNKQNNAGQAKRVPSGKSAESPPRVASPDVSPRGNPPAADTKHNRPAPAGTRDLLFRGAAATLAGALLILVFLALRRRRGSAAPANVVRVGQSVLTLANAQHIGTRSEQQDAFGFSDPGNTEFLSTFGVVGVVADGMGGMALGSQASNTAVRRFFQVMQQATGRQPVEAMVTALKEANTAVAQLAVGNGVEDEVGTTFAAVSISDAGLQWVAAGDTRVYLYRDGKLTQLNADHNYRRVLARQVADGLVSAAEADSHPDRQAVTSYLGASTIPEIDQSPGALPVQAGDRILICSDGLYNALDESSIASIVAASSGCASEQLVASAVSESRPQQDNLTVVEIAIDLKRQFGRNAPRVTETRTATPQLVSR